MSFEDSCSFFDTPKSKIEGTFGRAHAADDVRVDEVLAGCGEAQAAPAEVLGQAVGDHEGCVGAILGAEPSNQGHGIHAAGVDELVDFFGCDIGASFAEPVEALFRALPGGARAAHDLGVWQWELADFAVEGRRHVEEVVEAVAPRRVPHAM